MLNELMLTNINFDILYSINLM